MTRMSPKLLKRLYLRISGKLLNHFYLINLFKNIISKNFAINSGEHKVANWLGNSLENAIRSLGVKTLKSELQFSQST